MRHWYGTVWFIIYNTDVSVNLGKEVYKNLALAGFQLGTCGTASHHAIILLSNQDWNLLWHMRVHAKFYANRSNRSKQFLRYGYFSIFQHGGRLTSWIFKLQNFSCQHSCKGSPPYLIWLFSGNSAIHCVLLILWIASCFHIMGPVGQNQAWRCFIQFARCRHQSDARGRYI